MISKKNNDSTNNDSAEKDSPSGKISNDEDDKKNGPCKMINQARAKVYCGGWRRAAGTKAVLSILGSAVR
jgi:hypothetical protein